MDGIDFEYLCIFKHILLIPKSPACHAKNTLRVVNIGSGNDVRQAASHQPN